MQLVRVIETGGIPGLSRRRIYYAGQSFGGIYGTKLLAVETRIRAGVPNVPGGADHRDRAAQPVVPARSSDSSLATRIPTLLNTAPLAPPPGASTRTSRSAISRP